MDYQFNQDDILGCQASFAMPHEAFGYWLNEALNQPQKLDELSLIVLQAKTVIDRTKLTWQHTSDEYLLTLEDDSAQIRHRCLSDEYGFESESLEENFNFYDEEASSHCGLEDFIDALEDWQIFVTENSNQF